MKIYCMCQITGSVPTQAIDSQGFGPIDNQVFLAPNRFGFIDQVEGDPKARPVILSRPMEFVQKVEQRVSKEPVANHWPKTKEEGAADIERIRKSQRLFPDVDLFRCPVCGAMVVVSA
jgi:hypothetical protein